VHAPPPNLPRSLARYESLLVRLLAKSRKERFAEAEEIITAIAILRDAETPKAESTAA